jgi:hypothetical protein
MKLHAGDHQGPVLDGLLGRKDPVGKILCGTGRIGHEQAESPTTLHLGDHLGDKTEKPHHLIPLPGQNGRTSITLRELPQKANGRLLIWETGLIAWSVQVLPGDRSVMETSPNEEGIIHGFQDQGIHQTRI